MKKLVLLLLALLMSTPGFAKVNSGSGTVTTAGTAVQVSTAATKYNELTICSNRGNTGTITVGDSTVDNTEATEIGVTLGVSQDANSLDVGHCFTTQTPGKLSDVYVDASVNGSKFTYNYQ